MELSNLVALNVLIMDADFSHPPEVIPKMMRELKMNPNSIIIGSRFVEGGKVVGWPAEEENFEQGGFNFGASWIKCKTCKRPNVRIFCSAS